MKVALMKAQASAFVYTAKSGAALSNNYEQPGKHPQFLANL
jgi:hypothetical protein